MTNPNASYTDALAKTIETNPCPMAVVSYVGKHDADGLVKEGDYLHRMYGTRDMRHVRLYGLTVISLNKAARN